MLKKYLLRYAFFLLLALLLLPIKLYFNNKQTTFINATPQNSPDSISVVKNQALYDVAMSSSQEGWAVGGEFASRVDENNHVLQVTPQHGLIWHYSAGNWVASATIAQPLLSLALSQSNDGWAVGYGGTLLHYNGSAWAGVSSPTQETLRAVAMLSPQDVWAVGFGGIILHYDGQLWSSITSPTHLDLRSISMVSSDEGWIAGDEGTLLHYQNHTWQQISSPTTEKLNRILMLSTDEGWAVGTNGVILHDRAGLWVRVNVPDGNGTSTLYGITMTSLRSGWIVGGASLLFYDHEIWNSVPNEILATVPNAGADFSLYSLAMVAPQEGWAIGEWNSNIVIYHYKNGSWYDYT